VEPPLREKDKEVRLGFNATARGGVVTTEKEVPEGPVGDRLTLQRDDMKGLRPDGP